MTADPFANLTVVEAIDETPGAPPAGNSPGGFAPGTKAACNECGKILTVTAKGELRQHKCVGEIDEERRKRPPGSRKGKIPGKVHTFLIDVSEDMWQASASRYVARQAGTDLERAKVVTKCSNVAGGATALFGPPWMALWPNLPKGMQKAIENIAEHEELIACVFAWTDYLALQRDFIRLERERLSGEQEQEGVSSYGIEGPLGSTEPGVFGSGIRFEPAAV